MKLAIIYTAKSDAMEAELFQQATALFGADAQIATYQDMMPLKQAAAAGYVTTQAAAGYTAMIVQAIAEGADAVLSTCCFMGDVVLALQPFAAYSGVPIVSIDQQMCSQVAAIGGKAVLLFTAPVAGKAVGHTLERAAQVQRMPLQVTALQATDTAGLAGDALAERFAEVASAAMASAGVLVLAQPSMAGAAPALRRKLGKNVVCPMDDGMAAVRVASQSVRNN